jgi:hypothetical protein
MNHIAVTADVHPMLGFRQKSMGQGIADGPSIVGKQIRFRQDPAVTIQVSPVIDPAAAALGDEFPMLDMPESERHWLLLSRAMLLQPLQWETRGSEARTV